MRLHAGSADLLTTQDDVQRGAERASATRTEERDVVVRGTLTGVLAQARRFEFKTDEGPTLRGHLARGTDPKQISAWMFQPGAGRFRVGALPAPGQPAPT